MIVPMELGKKTMRHFYCRDALWETFEQMASDFDCSVDYLVNESMRYYARSKNYQPGNYPPSSYNESPRSSDYNSSRVGPAPRRTAAPPPPPGQESAISRRPSSSPSMP